MSVIYTLQASFVRGELTPKLRGRVDIEQYGQGATTLTNWLVMPQGGIERRPGTIFLGALRDESETGRLIEFEFNEEQAYALIFNDAYIRFATLGGFVVTAVQDISAITKANPGVLTYVGADSYTAGDRVLLRAVGGMVELRNREVRVGTVTAGSNTFNLLNLDGTNLDTSAFTAYTSGGNVSKIYEVAASDYVAGIIFDLQFSQAADTVYIADDGNTPAKLVRSSETSWTLSDVEFDDGPWLEENTQGTTMTPAGTGGVVAVAMTSNSTSSYTAADSDTSADAFQVFDREFNALAITGASGWVSIDFPSSTTKIADAYWIRAATQIPENTPVNWTFEGYNGSSWIVIDAHQNETAWGSSEVRYYEFDNKVAYRGYRLQWFGVDGGTDSRIKDLGIHEEGDSQTAVNLTASAVTGINGNTGFQTTDVGRMVRLMGTDGVWRWARIIARTSTTVVTVKIYGHALYDLTPITRWQLSAWSATDGYPLATCFYQDRLSFAGSTTMPRAVWASESANYESHHVSAPVQENDAIAVEMTGNQLSAVNWIEEMGEMIVGSGGAIRVLGPAAQAEPFSSYNVQSRQISSVGSAAIQPLATDGGLLYVDRYRKRLMALRVGQGGYEVEDISWWSEHLLKDGVVDMAFQADRHNVAWLVDAVGDLVAMTYQPEFGVIAFTAMEMGGTGVEVDSAAAIPSAGGSVAYFIVRRTINGQTRRYIEYMAPRFEWGDTLADAVYFDSAFVYSGVSTATITGVTHLIGETVGLLVDGVDVGDVVVSAAGTVTSPTAGTKITGGLRYTSRLETLHAPTTGNKDGSSMGRQQIVHSVALDLLTAKGLRAGTQTTTDPFPHGDREAAAGSLNTGIFRNVPVDDKHDNKGVIVVTSDKGYPATVRSVIIGLDGAP